MDDTYTHGHHESVLRSHRWRTVENSAAYLLAHLDPGMHVLDVGCGPGTITLDLANRVAPGTVIGVDNSPEIIAVAEQARVAALCDNVGFAIGDTYALDFDDEHFDVVHAHQVMQHLTDPVAALTEIRRVLTPDGLLAIRDQDLSAQAIAPFDARLRRWTELHREVYARNSAEPNAGRYLLNWVRRAGFSDITLSSSTWTFADTETRAWWGTLWADRCLHSSFAEQAVAYGLSDQTELKGLADAWREWSVQPDACIFCVHGEVLARR
ncbi:MAG: methyltransferase domain-containing protein [Acidimicrobiia bacterium]|nr:methyltransferase domain-containing protein [Acidimicrobiia bacterium]